MLQSQNTGISWRIPENNGLGNLVDPNEVVIGGVYLRLFIANPAWTLRKPREFLSELMETCLNLMVKDKIEVHFLKLFSDVSLALCLSCLNILKKKD